MRQGWALAVAGAALVLAPALAQPAKEARRELARTRAAGTRAQAESRRLEDAAAAADMRVIRARRTVAELDRAMAQSDAALLSATQRLAETRAASAASEAALARARAPLADLVATLVRRQRQPSSLLLAATPNVVETMRLHAALGAVAPAIDARAAALRRAVDDAAARRRDAAEAVAQVAARQQARDRQRVALRAAMIEETRQRDLALADAAGARQQADGLAEQAVSLEALVERLGRQDGARARLAALPGPELRPGTAAAPARAHAYILPARGRLLAGMGKMSSTGIRTRGILLAPAAHAIVRAPAAGVVAYAGAFRAWRAIVIIDHGHGWTTLIAGLGPTARPSGAAVAQGDPVGRAGGRLLIELRHHGRPVDIAAMAEAST